MIRIAVVEDDKNEANLMESNLIRYFSERNMDGQYSIKRFPDAVDFITFYRAEYDVIFMDIDLPDLNGMEAAHKLREKDATVILVFVTNLRQFAVEGYAVNALDFVVKPVLYSGFETLMNRVLRNIACRADDNIIIRSANGITRVPVKDLLYIEVENHKLLYHLTDGKTVSVWGTLKNVEGVPERQFARCNSGYLVNLQYVKKVEDEFIYIGDDRLIVSRAKRKNFLIALAGYLQV